MYCSREYQPFSRLIQQYEKSTPNITETIDAYVHCIRQVANFLGYQDLQVLEVFKNTLPLKLYWVFFPIEDLRVVVDTAKRMLTKEKIDKQLAGQTSSTPFMSVRDRVSFIQYTR